MVTAEQIESLRAATIADLGGILELLKPLEDSGVLVKRSRELIEMAIDEYVVIEREGMIIGCAALHPYPAERMAEVACLAIHPEYQNNGRGESLMNHIEKQAKRVGIKKVLVLSTQTAHWFLEKGFIEGSLKSLPIKRKNLYNFRRNSKIFIKKL
jgi:amino-acid N-acetyltransferase